VLLVVVVCFARFFGVLVWCFDNSVGIFFVGYLLLMLFVLGCDWFCCLLLVICVLVCLFGVCLFGVSVWVCFGVFSWYFGVFSCYFGCFRCVFVVFSGIPGVFGVGIILEFGVFLGFCCKMGFVWH